MNQVGNIDIKEIINEWCFPRLDCLLTRTFHFLATVNLEEIY